MANTYTTATNVEAELRAENAFSSSTTPTLSQVNNWIEEESRVVELRTNTIWGSTLASSTYFDYDGADIFMFPQTPINSITKLEYNVNANGLTPSWVTLEEGFDKNYLLYSDEGEVEFINGQNSTYKIKPKAGKKRLRISYSYGYATTPLQIQKITTKQVALRVASTLLASQANTEGGSIQVGTIRVADPSNYGVTWFNSQRSDIDNIYKDIGQELKVFRLSRRYD